MGWVELSRALAFRRFIEDGELEEAGGVEPFLWLDGGGAAIAQPPDNYGDARVRPDRAFDSAQEVRVDEGRDGGSGSPWGFDGWSRQRFRPRTTGSGASNDRTLSESCPAELEAW